MIFSPKKVKNTRKSNYGRHPSWESFFSPAGVSTRILFVSVLFWQEPRVDSGSKPRVESGSGKKDLNNHPHKLTATIIIHTTTVNVLLPSKSSYRHLPPSAAVSEVRRRPPQFTAVR